jgi:predicted helicase
MIQTYLQQIFDKTERGDAREESYYTTLESLLQTFATSISRKNIHITTLPKQTEAGNPDFRIWDGKENIVGYIEAKKPGENLDVIENSAQLRRYRGTFPNIILTDFYEFRLYRNGELIDKTFIARSGLARKKIAPPVENEAQLLALLEKFFSFLLPRVRTSEELARELAKRTRFLRDEVISLEMTQRQSGKGELYGFYDTFKRFLVANLKETDFADLFSQTITYGMFAARTRSTNGFNRKLAYDLIPKTIGILRNIFRFVSQSDLPPNMEVIVDDIAEVLNAADVKNILHQYYKAGKGDDPIVHFYETFLTEYDPSTREKRGVYYTPEPVVRYIVRSVHSILQTHFGLADGLAAREVTLLDPAGGTLTFPAEAIKLAVSEFEDKYGSGGTKKLISEHILKNFYAFELMMAPYAIGHIKISFLLEEMGYNMRNDERFKLYLTNTLDMEDLQQTQIPGLESLSEESHQAGRVKKSEPILVIMGNPPYSANSANYSDWTEKLLKHDLDGAQSYYKVDGQKLKEKNSKLLQDDYVKFLRFAQWKIHKAGKGVVAMITNHGYLSNVTFPGMRQSLMQTFNEIYIIDLHGDSQKKEKAPDGSKDENIFDITKGTAIAIFVKQPRTKGCKVFHRDIFGLRKEKYDWLDNASFDASDYDTLQPVSPHYFFVKQTTQGIEHYNDWLSISDIFPVNSTGIKTHRDDFVITFNRTDLEERLRIFTNRNIPDEVVAQTFDLKDNRDWKLADARQKLMSQGNVNHIIELFTYRPFDKRFVAYSDNLIDWPRRDVMQHMLKENIGLCYMRQFSGEGLYTHALVVDSIVDNRAFFSAKGTLEIAPLYLYSSRQEKKKAGMSLMMVFEPEEAYGSRKPNIAPQVFERLASAYGEQPSPEQIFCYCYGVLYSNHYRTKYGEFLKIDFPRIPFTKDRELFLQMATLGSQLVQLHLLKSEQLHRPTVKYPAAGDDVIEKPRYDEAASRVWINEKQYFHGITPDIWHYHIGGYQVLEKYLKDRKGRQMDDPATYCKIATAIATTIELQQQCDSLFAAIESAVL